MTKEDHFNVFLGGAFGGFVGIFLAVLAMYVMVIRNIPDKPVEAAAPTAIDRVVAAEPDPEPTPEELAAARAKRDMKRRALAADCTKRSGALILVFDTSMDGTEVACLLPKGAKP